MAASVVCLSSGDQIIMENPCYNMASEAFTNAGVEILQVKVDDEGIDFEELSNLVSEKVKGIYLTPRHQYPTMAELSSARRRMIVNLVLRHNLLVIEDDYDCDFSFRTNPLMPLSTMLPAEYYIYIGTFSKIIFPAVRVGYIAAGGGRLSVNLWECREAGGYFKTTSEEDKDKDKDYVSELCIRKVLRGILRFVHSEQCRAIVAHGT